MIPIARVLLCALTVVLAAAISAACSGDGAPSGASPTPTPIATSIGGYTWTQLRPLGSGGFPPAPGSTDGPLWEPGRIPVTMPPVEGWNGQLWMMSELHSYSSPDGLEWTQHDKASWGGRISVAYAFFKDRLWLFGGLRYQDRVTLNDIWSSTDGVTWAKAGDAEWPARKGTAVVVFQGKLWLFGGTAQVDPGTFDSTQTLSDVWNSDDGLHWTQVTAAAPWAGRDYPSVVVFNDELYLLGGQGLADVWRSTDGVDWTQLQAAAPWGGERYAYAAEAFDGKLWVFGGYQGKSTNAVNDVWYSTDGKDWVQQTEHAPWGPRDPLAIVYQDKLWIFSGKHTGGDDSWGGDVWTMSK